MNAAFTEVVEVFVSELKAFDLAVGRSRSYPDFLWELYKHALSDTLPLCVSCGSQDKHAVLLARDLHLRYTFVRFLQKLARYIRNDSTLWLRCALSPQLIPTRFVPPDYPS